MERKMFCYQCQETAGCTGCTLSGVCGKKPDVAAMQDLLVYVTKGLSAVTTALRAQDAKVPVEVNRLVTLNLFTTITNANFDKDAIQARIRMTLDETQALLPQVSLPEPLFDTVARVCTALQVDGHRADITMLKTARALAALEGRTEAGMEELRRAAELALPHRLRRAPFEQAGDAGIDWEALFYG